MSDAIIPWPTAKKTGRRSLILCGDLVRAVKSESVAAVMAAWGVSRGTVLGWRSSLQVARVTAGTHALMSGIATSRRSSGAWQPVEQRPWTEEEDAQIGPLAGTHAEVAARIGRTPLAVKYRRHKLGMSRRDAVAALRRMVGGDDLLDAMPLVYRLCQRLAERNLAGQREANEAYAALERLRELMVELSKLTPPNAKE